MNATLNNTHTNIHRAKWLAILMLAIAPLVSAADGKLPCWYTADQLNKQLGGQFSAGVVEPDVGLGGACKYSDNKKSISLFIGTTPPNIGMPPEMLKKFLVGPSSNKTVVVPKDPDGAAVIQHGGDIPPFPSIIYTRKNHTVLLNMTGMWDSGYADRKAAIKAWNDKLLKLPRVPN